MLVALLITLTHELMERPALLLLFCGAVGVGAQTAPYRAVAVIRGAGSIGSTVSGTVLFEQEADPDLLANVTVTVNINGLTSGYHGFHVHQYGDVRVTDSLETMDAHFVPTCSLVDIDNPCYNDQKHGLPPSIVRQPGDMGNLLEGTSTTGVIELGQQKMSLAHPLRSIIGRTVLIHANQDDGGQPYGNAGPPEAYGVIGLASTPEGSTNGALAPTVPKVTKVICTFEPPNAITGSALLTLLEPDEPDKVRAQARLTGLTAGSTHSFHFHEWGDMRPGEALGAIYNEAAIVVEELHVDDDGFGILDAKFTSGAATQPEALLRHVGRSLTIHDGPTRESPTIAQAVCGLAHPRATLDTGTPPWERGGAPLRRLSAIGAAMIFCALLGLAFLAVTTLFYLGKPIPLIGKYIYGPEGPRGGFQKAGGAEMPSSSSADGGAPPPPPPPSGAAGAAPAGVEMSEQVALRVEKI